MSKITPNWTPTKAEQDILRELNEEERRDRERAFWDYVDRNGWDGPVTEGYDDDSDF